ncbi:glycosyltransferase family 2 protein [Mucilaginibacter sp.]|uniref:glycosyltransferase family 2 protein n=1 Tax=Mucilaginibacter sp. TaxID=1882438 RepID=UPI003B009470
MILVSIIIPAYNSAQTIVATLASALQQKSSLFNIEIIVINDGSTDETALILQDYQSDCTFITQANQGTSTARQNGFNACKGNYIQYLDADDLLAKSKIELQLKALLANNADIAYGDFEKFSEKNNQTTTEGLVEGLVLDDPEITIFKNFWRPPAAILYARSIAEKLTWNNNLPVIQDARYLLDAVFMGGKLVYTPGVMAKYRINQAGSLSQRNSLSFVKDCFLNTSEVYHIWQNDLQNNPEKKSVLIESLRYCITEFSINDQKLFHQAIDLLLEIAPGYIPQKSTLIKRTSQVFGYRNAEKIASLKRKLI